MTKDITEILLVEDNPNNVELTLHTLKQHNLANHIEVVRDGAEALEFLFCTGAYENRSIEKRPGLILLDLRLPKVDGLELLRRIKSDPHTRPIPVVILTSSSDECDIMGCYEMGINSYTTKPVDFEQFNKVIKELGFNWLLLSKPPT